jgi:hypothetical protein
MVGGLLFLRRLFAAPALAQYVICGTMPGPGVATDDELPICPAETCAFCAMTAARKSATVSAYF